MNEIGYDKETDTTTSLFDRKLKEFDSLPGGPEILRSLIKRILSTKKNPTKNEDFGPQHIDDWNTWHNLYEAIQGYHSADGEEICKARSEIRTISRELFDYIDKEIGYIPFEEVYELGFILGFLPVTHKQLLERNGTMVYKEIQDTTKPYVILIDKNGIHRPRKLSEEKSLKLYPKLPILPLKFIFLFSFLSSGLNVYTFPSKGFLFGNSNNLS
jgi:hypothetical protein